jgi:hypothetical protein
VERKKERPRGRGAERKRDNQEERPRDTQEKRPREKETDRKRTRDRQQERKRPRESVPYTLLMHGVGREFSILIMIEERRSSGTRGSIR